jgi:phosphopantothenoylcysteine synthetase/decarboxylase
MKLAEILNGRRVLVTAGPTWVAVDRVIVITSISSGETGLRIARRFADQGCQVTLLMGPGRTQFAGYDSTRMSIHSYFFYDELAALIRNCLQATAYDVIVH